ncbi:MAG: hypothetical protein IJQ38_06135 [Bacteroidaceae bacterium]|nr:hypothetical protein [Bacteroidaceae bacterium]
MKQFSKTIWPLLCGVALLTASSCSIEKEEPELIIDPVVDPIPLEYSPLVISIIVLSPQGHSILPYTNLINTYAEFRGQRYYCNVPPESSRSYLPNFYGLKMQNDYLLFGELDGATEFKNEQVVIHWGNEVIKNDTIIFSRTFSSEGPVNDFWINGIQVNHSTPEEASTLRYEASTEWEASRGRMVLFKDLASLNNANLKSTSPISLTDELKQCGFLNNYFQINLLHAMLSSETKSIVTSPLSVAYLLAMIACGCGTDVNSPVQPAEEILLALEGIEHPTSKSSLNGLQFRETPMNKLLETVIEQANNCDPRVDFSIANAFFAQKGFDLYSGYVNYIAEAYHADYGLLDFTSPSALEAINAWSNQKTKGLVPKILDEVSPMAVAYLLNSIYFRAPWALPFNKDNTKPGNFTGTDGTQTQVQMMHQWGTMLYLSFNHMELVQLPFANGAFNMTIVLPKDGWSVEQLTEKGIGTGIANTLHTLDMNQERVLVDLAIPHFDIETTNDLLKEQLQSLGIKSIFAPEKANLTEISPKELYVSNMIQKARIKVDEEGCEAAATSQAELIATDTGEDPDPVSPIVFRADHPFLYFITERSSGLIFFAGAYCGD